MRTFNIPKLERVIKHYKLKSKKQVDSLILFCMAQKTLKEAIEIAAKSLRVSLSKDTTISDIDLFIVALHKIIHQ